jgi:hypothetical protein
MLNRIEVIDVLIKLIEFLYSPLRKFVVVVNRYLFKAKRRLHSQEFVFFTKKDNVAILNKVMQYVQANESTKKLKIVNVIKDGEDNELLKKDLEVLDRAYPEIDIEFIEIEGYSDPI